MLNYFHVILISSGILVAFAMAVVRFAKAGGVPSGSDLWTTIVCLTVGAGLAVYLGFFIRRQWGKGRPADGG